MPTPDELLASIMAKAKIVGQNPKVEEKAAERVLKSPKPKTQKKAAKAPKPKKSTTPKVQKVKKVSKSNPKIEVDVDDEEEIDSDFEFPELDPNLAIEIEELPKKKTQSPSTPTLKIEDEVPIEAIASMFHSYRSQYAREVEQDKKAQRKAKNAGILYVPSPRVRDMKKVEQFLQKYYKEPTN